jgi:hypothetical protein
MAPIEPAHHFKAGTPVAPAKASSDVPARPRYRQPMEPGFTPSGKLVQRRRPEVRRGWVRTPPRELLLPMLAYRYVTPSWLCRRRRVILLDYGKANKRP